MKKRRLVQKLAEIGVGSSSVIAIINALREEPDVLGDGLSRRDLERGIMAIFAKVAVSVELPRHVPGESFKWEFASFQQLLAFYCAECPMFREMVARLHVHSPCSPDQPWSLILYCDETTPGNPLRLDQLKKYMATYCTFKDWGSIMLRHDAMWLPIAVLRTKEIKKIRGGWPTALRQLLRHLLLGEGNIRLGVPIPALGIVLYIKVSNIIADEAALQQVWSSTGANGSFPAIELENVTAMPPRGLVAPSLMDISCTDVSRYKYNSNEMIWGKVDVLAAMANDPSIGKGTLESLETGYGLHHNPDGILQDHEIRPHLPPADVTTHDGMHALFSDGLCQTEVNLALHELQAVHVQFNHVRNFFADADFQQPGTLKKACCFADIFSKARASHFTNCGGLSTFASEMFGLVLPFTYFLEVTIGNKGILTRQLESFQKLAVVVRNVNLCKQGHPYDLELEASLADHGDSHILAYGTDNLKPKFLFARLLPRQKRRDKMWIDCWPCERKHSMMKSAGASVDNTRAYERSVLSRALWIHKRQLDGLNLDGLHMGGKDSPELASELGVAACKAARSFRVCGTAYAANDVLVRHCGTVCGRIIAGISYDEELGMIWEPFCNPVQLTTVAKHWEPSGELAAIWVREQGFRELTLAVAWIKEASGGYVVIR